MIKILVIAVVVLSGAVAALVMTRTPVLAPTPDIVPATEQTSTTEETSTEPAVTTPKPVVTNSNLVLDLSRQNLTKTPNYVFDRTEIQELNLSQNALTGALQAEVRHLQNLRVLNLSNNQFTGLPAEIGQLKNLEVLDVSNNELTGLPYELGNLQNLKVLNLSGNNYAAADLEIIKAKLPKGVKIVGE